METIALGADHAGFELKNHIAEHLAKLGFTAADLGTNSAQSVDYPDFAKQVGEQVALGRVRAGILVCGSGIGMSIAANKVPGVRAAHVTSEEEARLSREHNDANVLALGARMLGAPAALAIVDVWLNTAFAGGRHQRRVEKIAAIEAAEASVATKP